MNLEPVLSPEPPAPIYFDRSGEAIAPAGCPEADCEAAWLRVALSPGPLLIRGRATEKAALFYAGRGRAGVELQSPGVALESLGVDAQGLEWIRAQWGEEFPARFAALEQPLRATRVLAALFPAAGVSWSALPSRENAARWLLWRAGEVPDALQAPLNGQAARWSEAAPDVAPLYAPTDSQAARMLVRAWLGLEDAPKDFPAGAGTFPLPVPPAWQEEARGQWLADLAGRGALIWYELRARPLLGDALRREAAEAVATFLIHHPEQITPDLLDDLGESLSPETLSTLQDLVPPPAPPILGVDASADEALRWFHKAYWPFRRWQARQSADASRDKVGRTAQALADTRAAARSFGSWYLGFYARALAGGDGLDLMAGSRGRALRVSGAERDGMPAPVTLLVIVDGLHEGDAATLQALLKKKSGRLEVLDKDRAFTALPTITEVAKPALWWGSSPRDAQPLTGALQAQAFEPTSQGPERAGTRAFKWPDSSLPGRELREHADVSVLHQAQEGEIWVWNVLALDTAYHKNYPPATTLQEAAQVLQLLAERVVAATEKVPEHLAFRVVITADHGRLPGPSERCHPLPSGCKAHGRAALVSEVDLAPALAFTEQDFIWESDQFGERVWLNPRRFGLSAPAVLCADENAFALSAGARIEHFSHGGLWPEEVVVPWLVLARDQGIPHIHASVEGKAKAGTLGTLRIEARNGSEMSLILQEVRLLFGPRDERTMGVSLSLAPLDSLNAEIALPRWPDKLVAARAKAVLLFSRPDGSRFEVQVSPLLESEELYRASNILEDFDF